MDKTPTGMAQMYTSILRKRKGGEMQLDGNFRRKKPVKLIRGQGTLFRPRNNATRRSCNVTQASLNLLLHSSLPIVHNQSVEKELLFKGLLEEERKTKMTACACMHASKK